MPEPTNPFASPQTSNSDSPITSWATNAPVALRRVKLGLTLIYMAICGLLLGAICIPLLIFTVGSSVTSILALALGGLVVMLAVTMLAGLILCIAVPVESGARGLACVAVVLHALSFVAAGIILLVPMGVHVARSIAIANNLLSLGAIAFFLIFMRTLSLYLHRRDIARRATRTLIVGGVAICLSVTSWILGFHGMPEVSVTTLGGMSTIATLIGFVAVIMYGNTVTYLRKAINV